MVSRGVCVGVVFLFLAVGIGLGVLIGYLVFPDAADPGDAEKLELIQDLVENSFEEDDEVTDKIKNNIDTDNILAHLKELTKEPHRSGSERTKAIADMIDDTFEQNGLDWSKIIKYNVLLSIPRENEVIFNSSALVHPCRMRDKPIEKGTTDDDIEEAFNAYSPSKTVQGKLVYVNYGREKDFDLLEEEKIDVKGRIVIARYGKIFGGDKVKTAAMRGAVGIILYTDPEEVAPSTKDSDVLPKGKNLPGTGIQRGTIYRALGDPLTPGEPSIDGIDRIELEDADLPIIPSQPIGYNDAYTLLSKLGGKEVPKEWKGELNTTYYFGPEARSKEHKDYLIILKVNNSLETKPIFNVIGVIRGAIEPDRYVIIGNHHDAWTYGAVDPSASTSQLLELTRVFGDLVKEGWRPRRTIVFATWDAGKYGAIGSMEWVEDNLPELVNSAVAYINMDSCGATSQFKASASPLLLRTVIEVAKKIDSPVFDGKTLEEEWKKEAAEDDDDAEDGQDDDDDDVDTTRKDDDDDDDDDDDKKDDDDSKEDDKNRRKRSPDSTTPRTQQTLKKPRRSEEADEEKQLLRHLFSTNVHARSVNKDTFGYMNDDDDDDDEEDDDDEDGDDDDNGSDENSEKIDSGENEADIDDKLDISTLGAESDHAPFAFYAGISSVDIHADLEQSAANFPAAFNTRYDTYNMYVKHVDKDMKVNRACAQYAGVLVRYLADSSLLPFSVTALSDEMEESIARLRRKNIDDELKKRGKSYVDFVKAVDNFEDAAKEWEKRLEDLDLSNPYVLRRVNDQLMLLERVFVKTTGRPHTWYYRHLVYGPSLHDKHEDAIFPELADIDENIDEVIAAEKSEGKKGEASDEAGADQDYDDIDDKDDAREYWDSIDAYLSDLIVVLRQATSLLSSDPLLS